MQKLSGLVLDRYDDVDDAIFSRVTARVPLLVTLDKTAADLSQGGLERLPDDVFALVLGDGQGRLRKYAMADTGNTALSVAYFLELGHRLPGEAQKVAAAKLLEGCGWYSIIPPPELEKVALGVMSLANAALTVPGAVREAKNNLGAVQGAPGIMTPEQIRARRLQTGV